MQPKQVYEVPVFANKKLKGYKTKWGLFCPFEDIYQNNRLVTLYGLIY